MFIIYHCGCLLTYTYIYVYIFHHAKNTQFAYDVRAYEYSSKNFAPTLYYCSRKIAKIKRALLCTVHTYSKNILICHSRDKLNVGETNSFYHILYCCAKHTLTHGAKKLYLVPHSSNSSTKSDGDEANSPVCSYSYCSYYSF